MLFAIRKRKTLYFRLVLDHTNELEILPEPAGSNLSS